MNKLNDRKLRIGVWSFYSQLSQNNFMLTNTNSGLGDDALLGTSTLKKVGEKEHIDFLTLDLVQDWSQLDAILVFDYPKPVGLRSWKERRIVKQIFASDTPAYLVLHECEVIKPNNWFRENHLHWKRIFTWHDDFIDNKKYIKLNMPPRKIGSEIKLPSIPPNFSCMIATKKFSGHPKEAYSERLRCIEWYEQHSPLNFDLFGLGWEKFQFKSQNRFSAKLNKLNFPLNVIGKRYKVYKGSLETKQQIFGKYKFHFAFENAAGINGYILEKIFDAFLLGSVPIYYGAGNIEKHVPKDTFIDFREFDGYDELHKYLNSISSDEFFNYIQSINYFLGSNQFLPFSIESYVQTFLRIFKRDLRDL